MKKIILTIISVCIAATALTGCKVSETTTTDEEKLNVVCTIFPEYDWLREIAGEHTDDIQITYLLEKGSDLHNYQPNTTDIIKISSCDLFIHVGGESDEWVEDAIEESVNPDMQIINLIDTMGDKIKEEEIKAGMQGEEETEEDTEYDEHVWLSLKNAQLLCKEIESKLEIIDPENSADYQKNLNNYISQLDELDKEFEKLADAASVKTLVFGDKFPFRYFTDDYKFDYYAAFAGCSAETEASFETVIFLAQKLDELNLNSIFTIENSDSKIASTVIQNTKKQDIQVYTLNSIQSVPLEDNVTYISLMRENLETLKQALS